MSDKLPFINSTGLVQKILEQIIKAATPSRYTVDFQSTVLGYGSGSAKPFIPLLKRLGFLNSDGSPTDLYKEFRMETHRGLAMAKALKHGYSALYKVNEYAHELDKSKLKDAIIRVTGHDKDAGVVRAIAGTFEALKNYAKFFATDSETETKIEEDKLRYESPAMISSTNSERKVDTTGTSARGMNLSYTINLNLPASKDPEVFNAIFKTLKENLLN